MSAIDHFPRLHTRPARGWVNDPNGIGRWDDRWHVMFQWNPNAPEHGDIHWGHMSSPDLVSWRDEGAALRPRSGKIDAAGVWSGVAVSDHDGATLVYTAVSEHAGTAAVAIARPDGEGGWIQPDALAAEHPDPRRWVDVRDPFLLTVAGRRLGIMGAGLVVDDPVAECLEGDASLGARTGAVLVYDAADLDDWQLLGELVTGRDLPDGMVAAGAIWECPQLVPFGDRWLLVVSWDEQRETPERRDGGAPVVRRHGVACYVGDLDLAGSCPRFAAASETVLDHGPDFYAPQIVVDGARLLTWAWSWEGRGDGPNQSPAALSWAGTLTFPREVVAGSDGVPVCVPAPELVELHGPALETTAIDGGYELFTAEPCWTVTTVGQVSIGLVDEEAGRVRPVWIGSATDDVEVYVDGSIVEIFEASGSTTLRSYPVAGERWLLQSTGALTTSAVLRMSTEPAVLVINGAERTLGLEPKKL